MSEATQQAPDTRTVSVEVADVHIVRRPVQLPATCPNPKCGKSLHLQDVQLLQYEESIQVCEPDYDGGDFEWGDTQFGSEYVPLAWRCGACETPLQAGEESSSNPARGGSAIHYLLGNMPRLQLEDLVFDLVLALYLDVGDDETPDRWNIDHEWEDPCGLLEHIASLLPAAILDRVRQGGSPD